MRKCGFVEWLEIPGEAEGCLELCVCLCGVCVLCVMRVHTVCALMNAEGKGRRPAKATVGR